MAKAHSYVITKSNNKTETEAIAFLLKSNPHFIHPDKDGRKRIMEKLGLDRSFSRAFDLVTVGQHTNHERAIEALNTESVTLIELKTTQKRHPKNPEGFFFGATENEFKLARRMGDRYKFCFVSLHPESRSYALLTLAELEKRIKTKRVQYQINL
jgi:hypothetical protein